MNLPEGRRGQLIALTILLIFLILLLKLVVVPVYDAYTARTEHIDWLRDETARYQRLLAQRPALQSNVARFEQEQPLTAFLLPGGNAALAAAALQRIIQDTATDNGIQVVSMRAQSPTSDGPLERISVQARLQVDTEGLRALLHGLESGRPYLFVQNLGISARATRRNSPAGSNLQVTLLVSGLRAPGGDGSDG